MKVVDAFGGYRTRIKRIYRQVIASSEPFFASQLQTTTVGARPVPMQRPEKTTIVEKNVMHNTAKIEQ